MSAEITPEAEAPEPAATSQAIDRLTERVDELVVGKAAAVRLAVCGVIAGGHLLIHDAPGVGKTVLGQALARLLGLGFRRVPFTSDMLPADVLGAYVYNRSAERFVFHPGPIFTGVVLADEVNRAPPRTQSALLEAMEEGRVSVEGTTHPLPEPFFVIATQNPMEQHGTFPLPESQLDRFLLSLSLGAPDRDAERRVLTEPPRRAMLERVEPILDAHGVRGLQGAAARVRVAEPITEYILDLLAEARRRHERGVSPRAGLALQSAARAWALIHGRDHVLPDDVQAIGPAVLDHRLGGSPATSELIEAVPVR